MIFEECFKTLTNDIHVISMNGTLNVDCKCYGLNMMYSGNKLFGLLYVLGCFILGNTVCQTHLSHSLM